MLLWECCFQQQLASQTPHRHRKMQSVLVKFMCDLLLFDGVYVCKSLHLLLRVVPLAAIVQYVLLVTVWKRTCKA